MCDGTDDTAESEVESMIKINSSLIKKDNYKIHFVAYGNESDASLLYKIS